ncbi:Altered inheritance of mitochondria protein-like protein [Lachnellula occidentalis]|uniref:Altered inheritance of mitochondria protein 6 n=1 Tax=Lachnellula occidentalis TaxID=215460 RepID=A0A8H8S0A3_9HELO|nr:Altered inheritance of mitochondria protein-like protein [Lachnellula occidentalis]
MGPRNLIGKIVRVKQPVDLVDLSPPTSSRSSSQSSYDEPKSDRPWRSLIDKRFKYKHGSGTATRRTAYRNRTLLIILILCVLASIAVGTWYALVIALIKRLSPKTPSTGLQSITQNWQAPSDSLRLLSPWPQDFSRDITPIHIHSHNDYHRKVPLFEALAVGCVGIEADIWVRHDGNGNEVLLVGHSSKSLTAQRTLNSLYLDPLLQILDNQNKLGAYEDPQKQTRPVGIFETHPNESVVLLLDFKSSSTSLFPGVLAALEPLRNKGYLTTYTNNTLTRGPLTVVASGNAEYSDIISNSTYRDVFLDAPLATVSDPKYNTTNSYYASTSLAKQVGTLWGGKFSSKQLQIVKDQIKAASDKGLVDRYWDTISWPIPWRDYVWKTLMNEGTGMLNADSLVSAGRWNWDYCVVAGFILCD